MRFDAATGEHLYLSTACLHELHGRCRRVCEFCNEACLCLCHTKERPMTEPLDNPATAGGDLDDDHDLIAAQQRDTDTEGDPDALDPGDLNEPPAEVDPPEADQFNVDHDDDLADAEHGDDDGTEDFSDTEDPEADPDPDAEPDDETGDGRD